MRHRRVDELAASPTLAATTCRQPAQLSLVPVGSSKDRDRAAPRDVTTRQERPSSTPAPRRGAARRRRAPSCPVGDGHQAASPCPHLRRIAAPTSGGAGATAKDQRSQVPSLVPAGSRRAGTSNASSPSRRCAQPFSIWSTNSSVSALSTDPGGRFAHRADTASWRPRAVWTRTDEPSLSIVTSPSMSVR